VAGTAVALFFVVLAGREVAEALSRRSLVRSSRPA
jgi:hypothetical protein